ncbi:MULTISPECIES: hypothetical protein [unclassified Pseudoalteromonas]|uniref:hypothetical protein n=1 Tax=unclassified Pseudoalteromonas TaxID=194690 RepID=UPI00160346D9|nr:MULTISPECIES: hypothetical protein [unclassified Pseudoalteromonas]MBB1352324.1 hypothetical protein [Pseudoalteromonas sp. SG45-3]MBB1360248.1 hypothetical protein [Pseudoalteromonas sp. SG45-6]
MKDIEKEIAVERYKFILTKIQHLDESLYKNIGFIAKFTAAIISAIASSILLFKTSKITNEILVLAIDFASYINAFTCLLFILITLANIFSWRDYRKEEIELLDKCGVEIARKPPSFKGLLRWTETWFLIALLIIATASLNVDKILGSLITP